MGSGVQEYYGQEWGKEMSDKTYSIVLFGVGCSLIVTATAIIWLPLGILVAGLLFAIAGTEIRKQEKQKEEKSK